MRPPLRDVTGATPRRAPLARRSAGAAILCAVLAFRSAGGEPRLFRPLTADPRESQSRWRMVDYTEDWRYGTDVTDSTSRGGVVQDRTGVAWEVSGGETFRWI